MDVALQDRIASEIVKLGCIADVHLLKKFPQQGFMSEVYVLFSDRGELVVRVAKLGFAQKHICAQEKILAIFEQVQSCESVRVPRVFSSFSYGEYTIFISEFLPGNPAGARLLEGAFWRDEWRTPRSLIEEEIESHLTQIHRVECPLFGWGGFVQSGHATSETWLGFLEGEVRLWAEKIEETESKNDTTVDRLSVRLREYFARHASSFAYHGRPALVHGDLTNPSNILLQEGHVSGFIDWELSIASDPAWEFACGNQYTLERYFSMCAMYEDDEVKNQFRERIRHYAVLINGFWCFMHHETYESRLYQLNRQYLLADLLKGT